jgi:hypothetical protein
VILYNVHDGVGNMMVGALIAGVAAIAVGWAWWRSKQESAELKQMEAQMELDVAAVAARDD